MSRPVMLPDTTTLAGFDNLDPITQWFIGGTTAAAADATGVSDAARYAIDTSNAGTGGKAARFTSGNGTYSVKVDNDGTVFTGGFSATGAVTFNSLVTMGAGLTVTTGATNFGGTVTVTGAANFVSTLTVTGAVNFAGALTVTGLATFVTNVTIQQGLTVSQSATIVGNMTVGGSLLVTQAATILGGVTSSHFVGTSTVASSFGGAVSVIGAFSSTGVASFSTGVTVAGTFQADSTVNLGNGTGDTVNVAGSMTVAGNLTAQGQAAFNDPVTFTDNPSIVGTYLTFNTGSIDFDLGSQLAFTRSSWQAYVTVRIDGTTAYLPLTFTQPT